MLFFFRFILSKPESEAYTRLSYLENDTAELIESTVLEETFLRANIFFKSDELETRTQQSSFNAANLFSAIGGTMGLYAGISIVTIVETITIFIISLMKCLLYQTKVTKVEVFRATNQGLN